MKTVILSMTCLGLGALSTFGATCSSGATLAQLRANHFDLATQPCTIGSTGQWNLSNFLFDDLLPSSSPMTASDIIVNFTNIGTNGFSIQYSLNPNASGSFFSVNSPGQSISWRNGIWITGAGGVDTAINQISNTLTFASLGTAEARFDTIIQYRPGGITVGMAQVWYDNGTIVTGSGNPTTVAGGFGGYGNSLSINYRPRLNGRDSSTTAVSSYTNTFLVIPTPEPLTFGMIGFGLFGVAVLRRRA